MHDSSQKPKQPPTWRQMHADTDPRIEEIQFQRLREMPAWRKFEIVGQLNKALRDLILVSLHERYPDATAQQIRRILADKILGKELAQKAYGPCDYPHHEDSNVGDS